MIPIAVLIYLLMVERWTAGSAVFWSIVLLMGIIVIQHAVAAARGGEGGIGAAIVDGFREIYDGLVSGARNMVNIAVAVATAGIIVGAVSSTGLNNAMVGVVEAISGGDVYVLLAAHRRGLHRSRHGASDHRQLHRRRLADGRRHRRAGQRLGARPAADRRPPVRVLFRG